MIQSAINSGILSEGVIIESLLAFKRAGSQGILSYFTPQILQMNLN